MPFYSKEEEEKRKQQQQAQQQTPPEPDFKIRNLPSGSSQQTGAAQIKMPKMQKRSDGKTYVNLNDLTDETAIMLGRRLKTDEERDTFFTQYLTHIAREDSKNYRADVPTLKDFRTMADTAYKGGVYSSTKASIAQTMGAFNGMIDVSGAKVNTNTADLNTMVRAIRATADESTREARAKAFVTLTKTPGSRFYGTTVDEAQLKTFLESAQLTSADYSEYIKKFSGAFDARSGYDAQNGEKYADLYSVIKSNFASDPYLQETYIAALNAAYKSQTAGAELPDVNAILKAREDAAKNAPDGEKKDEKPWWEGAGEWIMSLFAGIPPIEGDYSIPEEAPKKPDATPEPEPTPKPGVEGKGSPKPSNAPPQSGESGGGSNMDVSVGEWQGAQQQQHPTMQDALADTEFAKAYLEGKAAEASTGMGGDVRKSGSVDLTDNLGQAWAYKEAGRFDELTKETQDALIALANEPGVDAWMGILGDTEFARFAYIAPDGTWSEANNERADYLYASNLARLGTSLMDTYKQINADDFPAEWKDDAFMAGIQLIEEANEWAKSGGFIDETGVDNLYEAYIREHRDTSPALRALNLAIGKANEEKLAREEAARLAADDAARDAKKRLETAYAAVRSGNYTPEQYVLVREHATEMDEVDRLQDGMYSALQAEIQYEWDVNRDMWGGNASAWMNETVLKMAAAHQQEDYDPEREQVYRLVAQGFLEDALRDQMDMAKMLGYESLEAYANACGGITLDTLHTMAELDMQRFANSITPEDMASLQETAQAVGMVYSGTGEGVSGWEIAGMAMGYGASGAVGDTLSGIYTMMAASNIPHDSARAKATYDKDYGLFAEVQLEADLRAMAEGGYFPSEEMSAYVLEYLNAGGNVFALGILPDDMGFIRKSAVSHKQAQKAYADWAQKTLNASQGKAFEIGGAITDNAVRGFISSMAILGTQSNVIGAMIGYGLGSYNTGANAIFAQDAARIAETGQLPNSSTMRWANLAGYAQMAATTASEYVTMSKWLGNVGGYLGLKSAAKSGMQAAGVSGTARLIKGAKAFAKTFVQTEIDEVFIDEIKEGLLSTAGEAAIGELRALDESGELSLIKGLDAMSQAAMYTITQADDVFAEVVGNAPEMALVVAPMAILGAGGAMKAAMPKTYEAAKKAAKTGKAKDAAAFHHAMHEEIAGASAEQIKAADAALTDTRIAETAVGIAASDPAISQQISEAAERQRQADAHQERSDASAAQAKAGFENAAAALDDIEAGDTSPEALGRLADGMDAFAKGEQGKSEHERAGKASQDTADNGFTQAAVDATTKAQSQVAAQQEAAQAQADEAAMSREADEAYMQQIKQQTGLGVSAYSDPTSATFAPGMTKADVVREVVAGAFPAYMMGDGVDAIVDVVYGDAQTRESEMNATGEQTIRKQKNALATKAFSRAIAGDEEVIKKLQSLGTARKREIVRMLEKYAGKLTGAESRMLTQAAEAIRSGEVKKKTRPKPIAVESEEQGAQTSQQQSKPATTGAKPPKVATVDGGEDAPAFEDERGRKNLRSQAVTADDGETAKTEEQLLSEARTMYETPEGREQAEQRMRAIDRRFGEISEAYAADPELDDPALDEESTRLATEMGALTIAKEEYEAREKPDIKPVAVGTDEADDGMTPEQRKREEQAYAQYERQVVAEMQLDELEDVFSYIGNMPLYVDDVMKGDILSATGLKSLQQVNFRYGFKLTGDKSKGATSLDQAYSQIVEMSGRRVTEDVLPHEGLLSLGELKKHLRREITESKAAQRQASVGETIQADFVPAERGSAIERSEYVDSDGLSTITPTPTKGKAKKNPLRTFRRLAKDLDVGQAFGTRKMEAAPGAAGYYDTQSKHVASGTLYASNIEVGGHELGHAVGKKLGMTGTPAMVASLNPRFHTMYGRSVLPDEAFAEFFWRYMLSDDEARDMAGSVFIREFEREMKAKGIFKDVKKAQKEIRQYMNAEINDRIGLMIREKSDRSSDDTITEILADKEREFITAMVDRTRPAEDVNAAVRKASGGVIAEEMNLRNVALMESTAPRRAWHILTEALVGVDGTYIGESLADRWKRVGLKGKDFELFMEYLLAKHSINRDTQDKPVFDEQSIPFKERQNFIGKCEREHPEFELAADELQEFWSNFMQAYMVDTGYLEEATFRLFRSKYPSYVPTKRVKERGQKGVHGKTFTIMRASGSTEEIINPLDSMVEMINSIVAMNLRNETAKTWDRIYQSFDGMGIFGREVAEDVRTQIMDMRAVQAKVDRILAKESLDDDVIDSVLDAIGEEQFRRSGTGDVNLPNIVIVQMPDGSQKFYEMFDQQLFEMLAGTPDSGRSSLEMLGAITRGMSMLTTGSNPLFFIRNAMRDYQKSVNYGSWASNYATALPTWLMGAWEVFTKSGDYQQYAALGGGGWTRADPNQRKGAEEYRGALVKGYNTSNVGRTAKWLGKKLWSGVTLERLNEIVEQTSRFVEYKRGKHDLTTPEGRRAAYLAAQEVTTDFSRQGASTAAREAKALIPFFNASVQSIYQIGRQFTDAEQGRAKTRFVKTVINAALTSALASAWLISKLDDDEREEFLYLSDDLKAKHLYIPNFRPDVFGNAPMLRIPLPQDPLTYAVHGVITNVMWSGVGEEWAIGLCAISDNIFNSLNPVSSTILDPVISIMTNKNWYGSNIVPRRMEGWNATTQYTEETPDAFVALSEALYKLSGQNIEISPMMLQYLAEQYTGFVGQIAIPYFSKNAQTGKINGISAVIDEARSTLTSDPLRSNDVVSCVYDSEKDLNEVVKAGKNEKKFNMLRETLKPYEFEDAYDEAYKMTHAGGVIYETKQLINEMYDEIESVEADQTLTDEQKYELTSAARRTMIEAALEANEAMAQYREKYMTGESFLTRWMTGGNDN